MSTTPGSATDAPNSGLSGVMPTTLPDQHDYLLNEVSVRATALLAHADDGDWPDAELYQLLDYLHLEVLRQINDEEWLLFRNYHQDPKDLTPLRQDHLALRELIDTLTAAASDTHSPAQLAALVRELIAALHTHIATEERVLGSDAGSPSTTAMGAVPHSWYALTEGSVIDLDALPGPQGVDAALGRLLRLRRGEEVELSSSSDPFPLWRRLAMTDPAGYGFTYLQQGPAQWRAAIIHRAAS